MRILIIDKFKNTKIIESINVPRIGDKIIWYHDPAPTVKTVGWDFDRKSGYDVIIDLE